MQNLLDKRILNDLIKDLQALVTTTTEPPVTLQQPVVVTSNKVNTGPQVLKAVPIGQRKKISGEGKVLSHPKRERKMLLKHQNQVQHLWLAPLLI